MFRCHLKLGLFLFLKWHRLPLVLCRVKVALWWRTCWLALYFDCNTFSLQPCKTIQTFLIFYYFYNNLIFVVSLSSPIRSVSLFEVTQITSHFMPSWDHFTVMKMLAGFAFECNTFSLNQAKHIEPVNDFFTSLESIYFILLLSSIGSVSLFKFIQITSYFMLIWGHFTVTNRLPGFALWHFLI